MASWLIHSGNWQICTGWPERSSLSAAAHHHLPRGQHVFAVNRSEEGGDHLVLEWVPLSYVQQTHWNKLLQAIADYYCIASLCAWRHQQSTWLTLDKRTSNSSKSHNFHFIINSVISSLKINCHQQWDQCWCHPVTTSSNSVLACLSAKLKYLGLPKSAKYLGLKKIFKSYPWFAPKKFIKTAWFYILYPKIREPRWPHLYYIISWNPYSLKHLSILCAIYM